MADKPKNQGEGDRESARRFNEAQREFVKEGGGEEAAEDRGAMTEEERKEAERAEQEGKSRAKEKDPNVVRDFSEGKS